MQLNHHKTSIARFFDRYWQVYTAQAYRSNAIDDYLHSENEYLEALLCEGLYACIIEAGCADGSFFMPIVLEYSAAHEAAITYIGIDLVRDAIRKASERLAEYKQHHNVTAQFSLIQGDICNIRAIQTQYNLDKSKSLIAFPFNAFGTLECPTEIIAEAADLGYDILIFTYATSPQADAARIAYYHSCNVGQVEKTENENGVLFSSDEGLYSYTYYDDVLAEWLGSAGFTVRITSFAAGLGRAFYARLKG